MILIVGRDNIFLLVKLLLCHAIQLGEHRVQFSQCLEDVTAAGRQQPIDSSVRLGCRPHAIKSAASTNSGTAIKMGTNMAIIAIAKAIPSVIVCFLVAIGKV
jgi:hypothetical protein